MKFKEALEELYKGKKIGCLSFPNTVFDNVNCYKDIDFSYIIFGEWFIVEEPGKTFPEVFEALKEGNHIRRKKWPLEDRMSKSSREDLLATDWEIVE